MSERGHEYPPEHEENPPRGSSCTCARCLYPEVWAAANAHADARWTAALALADWDGGVFHYDGRIYPWPRGFVPDCPATWATKLAPLVEAIDAVERQGDPYTLDNPRWAAIRDARGKFRG